MVQIIDFNEFKVFKSALGQHNMITILTKTKNYNKPAKIIIVKKKGNATLESFYKIINGNDDETEYRNVNQDDLFEGSDNQIRLLGGSTSNSESKLKEIFQKMLKGSKRLGDICNVNQGIVSGADKVTKKHISKYKIDAKLGQGIFVLSDKEIDNLIQNGTFNAFFVIGRTIGMIGHYLDEKRLNMPLYRHPIDDILYKEETPVEY